MEKYIKIRKLGAGSYGKVFLAKEPEKDPTAATGSGRLVCIKQIALHRLQDAALRARLRDEGKLMKKLVHPNLIRYIGAMETSSSLVIVMEYCAGGDLRNLLARRKRALNEQQVGYWFVQLLLGLEHMHHHRILHRDIKTANVFINNTGLVVLGDLGIARQLEQFQQADTIVGTPLYMSPEMFDGNSYDMRSDLWALGCVLYEMCVGQPPFSATSTPVLIKAICHGRVAPLPSHFSSRLQQVVKELLNVDPNQRPTIVSLLKSACFQGSLNKYLQDLTTKDEQEIVSAQLRRLQVPEPKNWLVSAHRSGSNGQGQSQASDRTLGHAAVPMLVQVQSPVKKRRESAEKDKDSMMPLISREEQILEALERLKCYRCDLLMPPPNLNLPPLAARSTAFGRMDPLLEPPPSMMIKVSSDVEPSSARLCAEWRDPVQRHSNLDPSPRRRNKSSSSEDLSTVVGLKKPFLGIPRTGVPLTQNAKIFASGSTDVRDLRKLYVEKAARQRGRQLQRSASDAIATIKSNSTIRPANADKLTKATPQEADQALLRCMNELEGALHRLRT